MIPVFYTILVLLPLGFIFFGLWTSLEGTSKKSEKKTKLGRKIMSDGLIMGAASVLSFLTEVYLLDYVIANIFMGMLPRLLGVMLILPVIAVSLMYILGGSEPIKIKKNPKITYKSQWKELRGIEADDAEKEQ